MGCLISHIRAFFGMTTKHPKYYFPDGTVIYQAERTLFKIHRYLVQQGTLGVDLPRPATQPNEGLEPYNPIPLPGVGVNEFESLLDVLYHPGLAPPSRVPSKTLMSALDVSDRYCMEDVSVRISDALQARNHNAKLCDSFAMMACCVQHPNRFPREFFLRQFTSICVSKERVDDINLTRLEGRMIANIMQGRELVREGSTQSRNTNAAMHWTNGGWESRNASSMPHWPTPAGWEQYLNGIFPATQAGGWTYGGGGGGAAQAV